MPTIPLISPGSRLLDTGVRTAQTARLTAGAGAAAWGKALQGVGQQVAEVTTTLQKAHDAKNLTNLSIAMSQAQVDYSTFQATTTDEKKWLGKWKEIQDGVQKQFDDTPLSEDARQRFAANFSTWSARGTMSVQSDVQAQAVRNAKTSAQTAIEQGIRTGHWTPAEQAVKNLDGLVHPVEQESMMERINGAKALKSKQDYASSWSAYQKLMDGESMMAETEAAFQNNIIDEPTYKANMYVAGQTRDLSLFQDQAVSDPYKALESLKRGDYNGLSTENKIGAEQFADGVLKKYQSQEAAKIADIVASGFSLDNYQWQWIRSPADQQQIEQQAAAGKNMSVDEAASLRLQLESLIGKYSLTSDPDRRQMIGIASMLDAHKKAVPQGSEGLVSMWNERRSGKPGTKKEIAIADNAKFLHELYKPKFEALMTGSGPDKKIRKGKEAEYRRLLAEQSDFQRKYTEGLPDDPTTEQAVKASVEILTAPAVLDATRWFENADGLPQGGGGTEGASYIIPPIPIGY